MVGLPVNSSNQISAKVSALSSNTGSSSTSNVGAIVGGVFGGLAGALVIAILLYKGRVYVLTKTEPTKNPPVDIAESKGKGTTDEGLQLDKSPSSPPISSVAGPARLEPFNTTSLPRAGNLAFCHLPHMEWIVHLNFTGDSSLPLLTEEEKRQIRLAALSATSVVDKAAAESKLFEKVYELKTGLPEVAAEGLIARMNVDEQEYYQLISKQEKGILEEVERFAEGSTDPAKKEVLELLNYILNEETSEKEYPNGIRDQGRKGKKLTYFLMHQAAQKAMLTLAEVVALRLYTTAAYRWAQNPA